MSSVKTYRMSSREMVTSGSSTDTTVTTGETDGTDPSTIRGRLVYDRPGTDDDLEVVMIGKASYLRQGTADRWTHVATDRFLAKEQENSPDVRWIVDPVGHFTEDYSRATTVTAADADDIAGIPVQWWEVTPDDPSATPVKQVALDSEDRVVSDQYRFARQGRTYDVSSVYSNWGESVSIEAPPANKVTEG